MAIVGGVVSAPDCDCDTVTGRMLSLHAERLKQEKIRIVERRKFFDDLMNLFVTPI